MQHYHGALTSVMHCVFWNITTESVNIIYKNVSALQNVAPGSAPPTFYLVALVSSDVPKNWPSEKLMVQLFLVFN
jgi:hypothetical protein